MVLIIDMATIRPHSRGASSTVRVISGVLLLIAAVTAYAWLRQPGDSDLGKERRKRPFGEQSSAPVPVALSTVSRGEFAVYLNGLGSVTAQRTVVVRSKVDGELVRLHFREGQMVKAGDLLAEIDARPFQIQLQQAEGQLTRDQALLHNAELDRQRYQTLLEQDSIAAQQASAQASVVKQHEGNVRIDQAQVDNAKLQLSYTRVTAPIDGRVGLRQVDEGNLLRANDAGGLLSITQLQPIDVLFTLPEDKLQAALKQWRTHPDISVEAFDRSGKLKLAEGRLKAIDNQIDPTTGTIKLKAQFDNAGQTLFVNQFVNIRMRLETLPDALQIPSAAVQHDSDGAYVFVAGADQTIEQRRVELGAAEGGTVLVTRNLSAGETVVVDGFDRLKPGVKIDVAELDGSAVAAKPDAANLTGQPNAKPGRRSKS